MLSNIFSLSGLTLLIALSISGIAAWYSVAGLTAIFAGAIIPIIVMGGILEVAKIVTTMWLHRYWHRAGLIIRTYLTVAVIALAFLTSMGIFGFLSKAHIDQGIPTSDVAAKVALIDEKIKTQRENIDLARSALSQMDAQVNARLDRGNSESGAERAVQIRRQQAAERARLQRDIGQAQAAIQKLNEERAPIASQLRKVEAEVGPIKYIAALIYGDNPDITVLERAVRWVTILIVIVFDPLAIVLILAASKSFAWDRYDREKQKQRTDESVDANSTKDTVNDVDKSAETKSVVNQEVEEQILNTEPESKQTLESESTTSVDYGNNIYATNYTFSTPKINLEQDVEAKIDPKSFEPNYNNTYIQTDGITKEKVRYDASDEYVHHDGKLYSINALKEIRPDLIVSHEEIKNPVIEFGPKFPAEAINGALFIRVDVLPHRVYKFNGNKWIEIDKNQSSVYLDSKQYLQYLIKKIDTGEYDPEFLTAAEQDEISEFLNKN